MALHFQRQILRRPPQHPQRQARLVGSLWALFIGGAFIIGLLDLLNVWQLGANAYVWTYHYVLLGMLALLTLPLFRLIWHSITEYWQADVINTTLLAEPMGIPVADPQPIPLPEDETLEQPEWFGWVGAFRRQYSYPGDFWARTFPPSYLPLLGLCLLIVASSITIPIVVVVRNLPISGILITGSGTHYLYFVYVFVYVALSVITSFFNDGMLLKKRLYATKVGLRWCKHIIPWHSITGFYCYQAWNRVTESREPRLYRVDGDGIILYWHLPLNIPQERYAVSDRFARFVTAYSMLPLRDATLYSEEMRANGNNVGRYLTARRAAGVDTAELEAVLNPPRPTFTAPQRRTRLIWSAFVAMPLAVLLIVTVILQVGVQQNYFAGLPARITARPPLFADTLRQPDGKWPITATTYYQNGAYHLQQASGTTAPIHYNDAPVVALLPRSFGDVAVQVTITGTYFEAGIIVRADAGANRFLVLKVDAAGNVDFQRCPVTTGEYHNTCQELGLPFDIRYKQVPFSGQALTMTHTIILASRGTTWTYFVDGTSTGSYRDDKNIVPQSGRVGIFTSNAYGDAAFTNFAVYPVDATLPWGY